MLKPAQILTRAFLFIALFGLAYFFSDLATWGFTIARLRTSQPLGPSEGVEPYLILKQKFYLKDQGGQSYVFISADEKYVLKFFKDMPRPWIPLKNYQRKKLGKQTRDRPPLSPSFSDRDSPSHNPCRQTSHRTSNRSIFRLFCAPKTCDARFCIF
jgi:hypothetical protein